MEEKQLSASTDNLPEITVNICTYNRAKFIVAALTSLIGQTLPKEKYEIIVIDNRSSDNTASLCKSFIEQHPEYEIRYYYEANPGVAFARNRAIQEARAPILTSMDDDAEATPDFLEKILGFLNTHPEAAGLGGRIIPIYTEKEEPKWINKFLFGYVGYVDYGRKIKRFNLFMKYPIGCNMTYRMDWMKKTGGFSQQLTFRSEDKYIFKQVTKLSGKVYYLPTAIVYHNIDEKRLEYSYFKTLFLKTGNEEKVRMRLKKKPFGLVGKFFELLFKTSAALAIYGWYCLQGKEIKGRYIFFSQWFTIKGFFQKKVFVR